MSWRTGSGCRTNLPPSYDVLGAAWLDVDGHDYIFNSVEIDRDDFGIIGGRSIAMGREQAAQVVGLMVDALLSGNIEIGDALQLKARVNEQVARVQQGEQVRRLERPANRRLCLP